MTALHSHDLKRIMFFTNELSECKNHWQYQSTLARQLQDIIGSDSFVYFDIAGDLNNPNFKAGFSKGLPETAPEYWCEWYTKDDPFISKAINNIQTGKSSTICSNEVIASHNKYINSSFYNNFLKPQSVYHVMTMIINDKAKPIAAVGLHRPYSASPFSEKDMLLTTLISPYCLATIRAIHLKEQSRNRQFVINRLFGDLPYQGVMMLDDDFIPTVISDYVYDLFDIPEQDRQTKNMTTLTVPITILKQCKQWKTQYHHTSSQKQLREIDISFNKDGKTIQGSLRAVKDESKKEFYFICLGASEGGVINDNKLSQFRFTRRELEIIRLTATGMTNPEIANSLSISARTVQNHLHSIYTKANVTNRTSLISCLLQNK